MYAIITSKDSDPQQPRRAGVGSAIAAILTTPGSIPETGITIVINLMKKFELCFEFRESRMAPAFSSPACSTRTGRSLPGTSRDALRFQYHYGVLPGKHPLAGSSCGMQRPSEP